MVDFLISVIIPVYNTATYLPAALESVLGQSGCHLEVVVINDGSPDAADRVIQPYLDRVRYIRQENKGLSAARNAGFRASRGEFICFLDADDLLLPGKFEKQMAVFQQQPDLGVVISGYLDVAEDGKTEILRVEKHWHRDGLKHLLNHEVFPPFAALVRRQALEESSLFPENIDTYESQEDWQLWLDLALQGVPFSSVPEPTGKYRHRAGSISADPLKHMDGARRVVRWLKNDPRAANCRRQVERLESIIEMERVARGWQAGRAEQASAALVEAVRASPAYWQEPFTFYRLFIGSLPLEEFARWKGQPDPALFEQKVIGEILAASAARLGRRACRRLSAAAYLELSDLAYRHPDNRLRRQAVRKALSCSPQACFSKAGFPSTLRGLLGPRAIGLLKRLRP